MTSLHFDQRSPLYISGGNIAECFVSAASQAAMWRLHLHGTIRMNWQSNIINDEAGMRALLKATRTIAVLGIKTEAQAGQPAFYVPQYLDDAGFDVVPVPVYYPDVTRILGRPVYRKLTDIPASVDLVNIFRRSEDVPKHVDDILAKKPKAVWMQLGIRNDAVAEKLAQAGIKVVQDRCLMVDHRRLASHREAGRPPGGGGK
jgi:predicted CoA-binding protein